MVVESVLKLEVERKPEEMVIFGFIVTSIAILLSLWVFPAYASFAMVTFTVMAILPFMVKVMKFEKEKGEQANGFKLRIHKDVILFFVFLFLGILLAFVLWFLLLPTSIVSKLYFLQINTITEINTPSGSATFELESADNNMEIISEETGTPSGSASEVNNPSGAYMSSGYALGRILKNNFRILALCILFSFVFGSGAIFILTWNASVLGVALGNAIRVGVASNGSGSAVYFAAVSFAVLRFLLHGIPEVTAYFIGGLSGAVISFAILDYNLGITKFSKSLSRGLKDSFMYVILAAALLVVSALIEVFVSPLFIK